MAGNDVTGRGGADKRREGLRRQFWPNEIPWTGRKADAEVGWFAAPRSLPLILDLMRQKPVGDGKGNLGRVYLELLSRQRGQGVVEMDSPADHAAICGFTRVQTWIDLMAQLERAGFIKSVSLRRWRYGLVLIVHPTVVVQELLRDNKKVPEAWLNNYREHQIKAGERSYDELMAHHNAQAGTTERVVPLVPKQKPKN